VQVASRVEAWIETRVKLGVNFSQVASRVEAWIETHFSFYFSS